MWIRNEFGEYPDEADLLDAEDDAAEALAEAVDYTRDRVLAGQADPWGEALAVERARRHGVPHGVAHAPRSPF